MNFFKIPQNNSEIIWTKHVIDKMKYYQLSENQLKRVLRNYQRQEKGIAPGTIALMRPAGTKRPTEIWLMYQEIEGKKKIITAWRYPGISPSQNLPIPKEIVKELNTFSS
jgi:hypothetical protein